MGGGSPVVLRPAGSLICSLARLFVRSFVCPFVRFLGLLFVRISTFMVFASQQPTTTQ